MENKKFVTYCKVRIRNLQEKIDTFKYENKMEYHYYLGLRDGIMQTLSEYWFQVKLEEDEKT